jgi:hypothetical protein
LIIIKEDDLINMTHSPKDLIEPIWPANTASKQAAGHQVHGIGVKPSAAEGEV